MAKKPVVAIETIVAGALALVRRQLKAITPMNRLASR